MNRADARFSPADARRSAGGFGWKDGEELRLASRPEDLQSASSMGGSAFHGTVDIVMDLGYFRQVELLLDNQMRLKAFVSKDWHMVVGQRLCVGATRCLVYVGNAEPFEVPIAASLAIAQ